MRGNVFEFSFPFLNCQKMYNTIGSNADDRGQIAIISSSSFSSSSAPGVDVDDDVVDDRDHDAAMEV